jgi:hypothetical protein
MTTQRSAFPERLFEFAFNAAFIERNSAILVGTPDIPSQEAEKWLGYDVAFEIEQTPGVIGSVALQHKVARYVKGPGSAANADFREKAGNEYFAFPLDVDQFNIIQSLSAAKIPGVDFVYCAPLFVTRKQINEYYAKKTIEQNSIWIDVGGVEPLNPNEPHSIVYSMDGKAAWVFSTPQDAVILQPMNRSRERARQDGWNRARVNEIYDHIFDGIDRAWPLIEEHQQERRRLRRLRRDQQVMEDDEGLTLAASHFNWPKHRPTRAQIENLQSGLVATGQLLADYLGISWIVEVAR